MFVNAGLSAALDRISERAADVRRAFTPGALPAHGDVATGASRQRFTLDPMSVSAPDGAYFIVAGQRDTRTFTRNGSFRFADGHLVTEHGDPVLGRRSPGGPLEKLAIDPVDAALGRVGATRVESDGSVTYVRMPFDPRTGQRSGASVPIGRVALARFPASTALDRATGSLFPTGRHTAARRRYRRLSVRIADAESSRGKSRRYRSQPRAIERCVRCVRCIGGG